ncbi:MAG: hypothetical protein ACK41U_07350 [Paracoccus sp. (in: a-proteobacteria)]|uniref:hypothetical protein n=1 Tax=Paracoccus sp. TaxID=267 RepID=UPI00391B60C5
MPDKPLFLERASFHRRRLGDAARILPVLATLAVLLPVWWVPRAVSYAGGAVWFFALWAALIVAVWALHRALLRAEAATIRASEAVGVPLSPPTPQDRPPDAL